MTLTLTKTSLKSPSNELTMRNLVTGDKNTAFSPNVVPDKDKRPSYKEQRDSVKTKRSQRSHSIKGRSKPTSENKNQNLEGDNNSFSNSMANTNERHSALPMLNLDNIT